LIGRRIIRFEPTSLGRKDWYAQGREKLEKNLHQLTRVDVFQIKPPLDTSFKKNTAVIKRLRTSLTSENLTSILKDIATVSLEKYLSEVISAITEGLLKVKAAGEVNAAVEVVSALHQRFSKSFTPYIVWNLAKGLSTPGKEHLKGLAPEQREKEESSRLVRQRALLRVATELWLVNVLRSLDDALNPDDNSNGQATKTGAEPIKKSSTTHAPSGENIPLPLEVLKDLLSKDREGVNLTLVVLFLKNYAWDVLGISPRSNTRKNPTDETTSDTSGTEMTIQNVEANGDDLGTPLTPPNLQIQFKNVITAYFHSLSNYMVNEHRRLQQQGKRNAEAYVRSGEVFEDRQQAYDKALKAQEKLISNAQLVAETLGEDMPHFGNEDEEKEGGEGMIRDSTSIFKKGEDAGSGGMWEDDDQRRFYEDLVDLKTSIPSVLFEEGRKGAVVPAESKEDESKKETQLEKEDENVTQKLENLDISSPPGTPPPEIDAEAMAIPNKTIGAQVDALLIRLPDLTNRDLIDTFAFDFCFLNSKASRNRLIKVLQEVPRSRGDLLPYYGRLIATLGKAGLSDVTQGVVGYLDKEFRSLQRRKEKDQLGGVRTQVGQFKNSTLCTGLTAVECALHCRAYKIQACPRTHHFSLFQSGFR